MLSFIKVISCDWVSDIPLMCPRETPVRALQPRNAPPPVELELFCSECPLLTIEKELRKQGKLGKERTVQNLSVQDLESTVSIQDIGPQMGTTNLHQAARHLYEQEDAIGDTARSMEYFVEQHVGEVKKRVSGMTHEPDKVVGNDLLLEKALTDRAAENPQLRPLVGLGEQEEPLDFKGPTDEGEAGVQLLHVGKELRAGSLCAEELAALGKAAEDWGFTTDVARWQLHEFRAAMVGEEAFQAQERYRTAARHSFNALVVLDSGRAKHGAKHFATLNRFFRASDSATGKVLRVAQVTLYKKGREEKGLQVVNLSPPLRDCDIVPLEKVLTKYVFARDDKTQEKVYALPCFSKDL
jgi:hypothetical protein